MHKIQGLAPNFIPTILDPSIIDDLRTVDEVVARDTARRLAAEEGMFVGISAGAAVATALSVAETAPKGAVLLAMLPDTGERYLSTFLFDDLAEESDELFQADASLLVDPPALAPAMA